MKKYSFILVFIGIYMANYCDAQSTKDAVIQREKNGVNEKGNVKKNTPPQKVSKTKLTIITDEDCNLTLGTKYFVSLKKGETKTISVNYGSYKLTATNPITGDQYLADVNVKGNTSTIRIDLIGVREQRLRDSLLNAKKSDIDTGSISETGSPTDTVRTTQADVNTSQKAVANLLISNMVKISPGDFIMGDNLGDIDEGPEHSVTIREVQFGKYEVTQQQWETIMGTNPSINQGCNNCPVENISWNDIDSFLTKLNRFSSKTFRLPTEAEWEYTARKGAEFKDMKLKAWYNANAEKKTHPVGLKSPNTFGVYDLSGNVAEWCSDWYGLKYYKSKAMDNPKGPESGKEKVVRGGSHKSSEGSLRPSYRSKQNPAFKNDAIGLRLVMEK